MRHKMWIGGTWVEAADGGTRDVINPADGSRARACAGGHRRRCRGGPSARRGRRSTRGRGARLSARDRGTVLFRIAEAIRAQAAAFAETRHAQHGQADRRSRVRRQRRGALLRVLRRAGDENPWRDARSARQRAVDGGPRAGRRRRTDHPVELSAADGGLEAGAGAGGRVHGRAEAGGADAAVGACCSPRFSSRSICRQASSTSSPAMARSRAPRWSPIRASTRSRSPAAWTPAVS